ncbi:MAG: hypothetical protein HC804_06870 [Anaerolineae bacterium]|nr:hypothetical protein [Anaerolineae bacterium]
MNDTILYLIINSGKCWHNIYRAADELAAVHPLAWWERPCLRLLCWWAGRRLASVLELVPVEVRSEVLGMVAEAAGPE